MKRDNSKFFSMSFSSIYPLYVNKAERKGRTKEEVDKIICWLTGYTSDGLKLELDNNTDQKSFYENAPLLNPKRKNITGKICGVEIEDIKDKTMKEIRYLDKLIDELAKGRSMEKILSR
jgi:hypothetical protein